MKPTTEKAWTCINRWRRRGYVEQVAIFEMVMAENAALREALAAFACDCGLPDGEKPCPVPQKCRNYIARAALAAQKEKTDE